MEKNENRIEKCVNPDCGRTAAPDGLRCETCELERMLYRRDLRPGVDKEPALESR
jgi:hypothetical protein